MKNKAKRLLALVLTAVMIPWFPAGTETKLYAADAHAVSATKDGNSIVIGNDYISREFSVADGKVETVKITNKRTDGNDTVFIPNEGSEEFIIKATKKDVTVDALNRTGWKATADSYQNASGDNDGPPSNLLDGRTQSIWHSSYNASAAVQKGMPCNIVITLNGSKEFQALEYTGRTDSHNGRINGFNLYIYNGNSEQALGFESKEWGEPILSSNFQNSGSPQYANLPNKVTATQIRIEVISTYGDQANSYASGAEINLLANPVESGSKLNASQLTLDGDVVIKETTATINDVKKTGKKITFNFAPYTFDGVEYTISEHIVMYDGDHFMRKYMEISVPESDKDTAVIDYIDLESMVVNDSDATWTIPTTAGGIVEMDQFKANLGQPIYIQGMFFGCEFPAADTEIVNGTGYMRYYTGKSFDRLVKDSQAAKHDDLITYNTWQTVAGAARSTELEVIQSDFFEYIKSIATPSEFRIQYNSWFDNMMKISDESILKSFIEIDRELNEVETRPLDSYVVDDGWTAYNNGTIGAGSHQQSGSKINETGFWEFNEKFPQGLTPSSELVQKFGSNFGVWVGPRGGYNFYGTLADILVASGKGSKAAGSIDVADRTYVENFKNMAVQWQTEYGVNYWKWDGFVDRAQYGAFAAADGVPGYANRHMTGGYQNMYHVTDLWEAWIDLMEACRENAKERGVEDLWISLTCYVNPSPWFLQWANSVWLQCTHDQKDADFGTTKLNKQITYRDACYYDFLNNHKFQFPLSNVYNHDPVYGVEGTGMNINTATDEDFKNYLYMLSTRGTAFWELYFSDSIMTPGKYEATAEFLAWAEENYHMLKNAKMIGGQPDRTYLGSASSNEAYASAYGFSCFDGTDGILSLRNPATTPRTIEFTFDRTMGVAEDAGVLNYHLEHTFNLTSGTEATGTLEYGKTYTITLQPNEVRILRVSKGGDQVAPEFTRAYTDGDKTITVRFNEKVVGSVFSVEGADVAAIEKSVDDVTYRITLKKPLEENTELIVTALNVKDLAGNPVAEKSYAVTYVPNNKVVEKTVNAVGEIAAAEDSLSSNNGFTVAATVETAAKGAIVAQGESYELGIDENGKAYFTLNGATATSEEAVADGAKIVGVKENNGILKLYVNDELVGSAYKVENRYYVIPEAAITAGGEGFGTVNVKVYDYAFGYDKVATFGKPSQPGNKETENLALNKNVTAAWTESGSNAAKGDDRPMSMAVDGSKDNTSYYGEFGQDNNTAPSYMQVDLDAVCQIESINLYRYWHDGRTYKNTVVAIAENEADFANGAAYIVYNTDTQNLNKLGAGNDQAYAETSTGKTFTLDEVVSGRYVRVYMNGTTGGGTTNHVVELEVMGYRADDDTDVSGVDLNALLARLKELVFVDTTNATEESLAEFNALVEEGLMFVEVGTESQEAVDAMLAKLEGAEDLLVYEKPVVNPFEDVKEEDYYYNPVLWAVENGITTGTSATTFSPEDTCTRGAVVTFLWRAAGCPEPEAKETAFVDITEADYYYKAVLWAVEQGITTGTSATTFDPNAGCTRGQVVTFLFRASKEEVPTEAENAFTDVEVDAYYADAVLWAVENGITTGTSVTTFEPDTDCTRGQIVTFIYRSEN